MQLAFVTAFAMLLTGLSYGILPAMAAIDAPPAISQEKIAPALARLAIPFEENRGQSDARVAFQARTLAGPLFVTREGELVWSLSTPPVEPTPLHRMRGPARRDVETKAQEAARPDRGFPWAVVERFVGGKPKPSGAGTSPTRVNAFRGEDPSQWYSNLPTWERVALGAVWDGVEVTLAARGNNVEKLFTLAPSADPSAIAIAVAGGRLRLGPNGTLTVQGSQARDAQRLITFTTPMAWQTIDGSRKPVQVAYQLVGEAQDGYGFAVGPYDRTRPLVIDPLLQATYLGASGEDSGKALSVTADGVYVAGDTYLSTDFPGTSGGAQPASGGEGDAFVARLSHDLRTLHQATYLGGSVGETVVALAVTGDGVYVAGMTGSTDFPGDQRRSATNWRRIH